MMSFGCRRKMRTAARRCCSPTERTLGQSQAPPKPSAKRSGRSPSPTLANCARSSASWTRAAPGSPALSPSSGSCSSGYVSCVRRSPSGMYGRWGRKMHSLFGGLETLPLPALQRPATTRSRLLLPTPEAPTKSSLTGLAPAPAAWLSSHTIGRRSPGVFAVSARSSSLGSETGTTSTSEASSGRRSTVSIEPTRLEAADRSEIACMLEMMTVSAAMMLEKDSTPCVMAPKSSSPWK
mmetsp:Transcript_24872/g.71619  ORF Transcript_24872/g.71619 Transcript_24872/m.71619 type:complete len:237 (-) Transcript_24872:1405-2115(-)